MEKNEKFYEYSEFKLYSYWRASCPYRVRLYMNLKKIPYTVIPVNLLKKENLSEEYLNKNSHGKIPLLEFTEKVYSDESKTKLIESEVKYIVDSNVIIEFLEEIYPENPLLPKGKDNLILRSKIKALAMHIACSIHPIQNISVLSHVEYLQQDKLEWAKHFIFSGLRSVEQELKYSKGLYCFGDTITLADVYLIPQLYQFKRNHWSFEEFPLIKEIFDNCSKLEAFKDAEPENQIDAVK